MGEKDEIVHEFLVEAFESLDNLDQEFVSLENDPENQEILNSIFRAIHTIKGTCGFLEFFKLESLAHTGESLLDNLRSGKIIASPEIISALLELIDAIRVMLSNIESGGDEGEEEFNDLKEKLKSFNANKTPSQAADLIHSQEEEKEKIKDSSPPQSEDDLEELFKLAQMEYQSDSINSPSVSDEEKGADEGTDIKSSQKDRESKSQPLKGSVASATIRVDVNLLDTLMNLVGELVLTRNQILQHTRDHHDPLFINTSQQLNLITSELQEQVMKTRMQPISNVWNKFPRVVRDVAKSCGKEVRLEMEGKETELDKTILEAIKDPLTHIVRNSVDHGIELPEERAKRGKPEEGVLKLKAFHEGGYVIIEISDDGAGIDPQKVKAKALSQGLLPESELDAMGDQELQRLIFMPGFSTAKEVTNISGRGVGMDVVRSNIEKIGGSVSIQSVCGEGTTLFIKIPLTLAIVPALIVAAKDQRFAIPQVSLIELIRADEEDIRSNIEDIKGTHLYRLRGNLLPLVYLNDSLRLDGATSHKRTSEVLNAPLTEGEDDQFAMNIAVVRADDKLFGLVVDAVYDTEEIVVKPLGDQLKDISVYSGATIMGDGRIALILDMVGLGRQVRAVSGDTTEKSVEGSAGDTEWVNSQTESAVIVRLGGDYRLAFPLSGVNRLEEFEANTLERLGDRLMVQYRGGILPLLDLSEFFGKGSAITGDTVNVIVHGGNGRAVGLVVGEIVDIVEESFRLEAVGGKPGIKGTAVLNGKITDFIDVPDLLQRVYPEWAKEDGMAAVDAQAHC
ncbi:MAG: histidine kinase [Candidatus Dadabacteria bacterium]|nr:MAG: histidine kinase [Candidatus Dadabacteria bacterium]